MELWRTAEENGTRPAVMSGGNLVRALVLHVLFFAFFFVYACVKGLFAKDVEDPIQFIDPTVVVNENLDGEENEPPPLQNPEEPPPPPPPKPQPKPVAKKPDPPKELEKIVTNIVRKIEKREEKKEEVKKEEAKKEETKKAPEKSKEPQKTKEQLRKEKLEKMRKSAKQVKGKTVTITVKNAPSGNGRTDKKTLSDAEIMKLLNAGYRPGKSTNLAANEEQLGYSLIKRAFEDKWDQPPWTDTLKPMTIRVWFGGGGRVLRYSLEASSGDAKADQSIRSAAARVGSVPALPSAFIDKYRSSGVPIRFTVKPQ